MTSFFAAFIIGIVSAGHCIGMCGGLMAAAGLTTKNAKTVVAYNVGRFSTYMILALIVGLLGIALPTNVFPYLQLASGGFLILTLLYFSGASHWVKYIEKIGQPLWQVVKPISQRVLPVNNPTQAFILGTIWGLIPCGLVYTALAFSISQPTFIGSLASMAGFGLGTFPAMITSALAASKIKKAIELPFIRLSLMSILALSALYIWANALQALGIL